MIGLTSCNLTTVPNQEVSLYLVTSHSRLLLSLTVLLLLGLTLHTTWRDMSEDLVTDTEVHTDLDPLEAPDWSVEVSLVDKPECLLAKHLDNHLALCSDTRTVRMLIGELLEESEGDAGMGQVLDLLVLTSYSLADLSGLVRPLRRSPTGGLKN